METFMKVNLKIIKKMDMDFMLKKIIINTMDIGKIINLKEKEF